MSTVTTFDSSDLRKTFVIFNLNNFVSNTFHAKAKHCFEGTYKGASRNFAIGFSNTNKTRVYAGYLTYGEVNPRMINKYNETHYTASGASFLLNTAQKILVCLDSEKSLVYAFCGEKSNSYHITLEDTGTWYAFVAGNADKSVTKVSLNLGFEPFENKLPEGFSPWIFGVDGINFVKRNPCQCTKKCSRTFSMFVTSINLLLS